MIMNEIFFQPDWASFTPCFEINLLFPPLKIKIASISKHYSFLSLLRSTFSRNPNCWFDRKKVGRHSSIFL